MKGYPKWFSSRLISVFFSLLVLTGIALIPTTLLRMEIESPLSLTGDLRISVTALHSIFSYIIIAILGALLGHHVRLGLRIKRKVINGFAMITLFALLAITGIAIYYIGNQEMSLIASLVHLGLGLLLPIFYVVHLFFSFTKK